MLLKGTCPNAFSLSSSPPLSLSFYLSFSYHSCSPSFLSLSSLLYLFQSQWDEHPYPFILFLPWWFASPEVHNNVPNWPRIDLSVSRRQTKPFSLPTFSQAFVTVTMLCKDTHLPCTSTRYSAYWESSLHTVDPSFCFYHILLFSWYLKWFWKHHTLFSSVIGTGLAFQKV